MFSEEYKNLDLNAQAFIEELVKYNFPYNKIRNVTPFYFMATPISIIEYSTNILYFCNISRISKGDIEIIDGQVLLPLHDASIALDETFLNSRVLFTAFQSSNYYQLIGFKIEMDSAISMISDAPPSETDQSVGNILDLRSWRNSAGELLFMLNTSRDGFFHLYKPDLSNQDSDSIDEDEPTIIDEGELENGVYTVKFSSVSTAGPFSDSNPLTVTDTMKRLQYNPPEIIAGKIKKVNIIPETGYDWVIVNAYSSLGVPNISASFTYQTEGSGSTLRNISATIAATGNVVGVQYELYCRLSDGTSEPTDTTYDEYIF